MTGSAWVGFILVTLCCVPGVAPAQFCAWPHGARGAYSITLDDNYERQFTLAQPLLDERGIRATFFVHNPGSDRNRALLYEAVDSGHEIGAHSLSHGWLPSMDSAAIELELRRSREIIDSLYPRQRCITFAYPSCAENELVRSIAAKYYLSSRTCGGQYPTAPTPYDFHRISGVGFGNAEEYGPTLEAAAFNSIVNEAIRRRAWITIYCHDFDAPSGTGWVSSDTFAAHLDYIVERGDTLFTAPFGVITRYIYERMCARLTLLSAGEDTIRYCVTDTLADASGFDVPLTAAIDAPPGWTSVRVWQNGEPRWSAMRNDSLLFDAVPDGRDVLLVSARGAATAPSCRRHAARTAIIARPNAFSIAGRRMATETVAPTAGLVVYEALGRRSSSEKGPGAVEVRTGR